MRSNLFDELALDGWYDMTPADLAQQARWSGRVCVQKVGQRTEPEPDWVVTTEIMRAWDGRTWIVYATDQRHESGGDDIGCAPAYWPGAAPRDMLSDPLKGFDEIACRHYADCSAVPG